MATTVLDALRSAQNNFNTVKKMGYINPFFLIAKEQLDNALEALDNGLKLNDVIQESPFDEVKTK